VRAGAAWLAADAAGAGAIERVATLCVTVLVVVTGRAVVVRVAVRAVRVARDEVLAGAAVSVGAVSGVAVVVSVVAGAGSVVVAAGGVAVVAGDGSVVTGCASCASALVEVSASAAAIAGKALVRA
jgi:hypothetical protein